MLKKALLIGINEYSDVQLKGCVNDVKLMQEMLTGLFGFSSENIKILLNRDATKQGILDGLAWLKQGGAEPASRLLHYSGHGHFVPDENGDEKDDGRDEALVPIDGRYIIDDELQKIYQGFPPQDRLTLIMDCCHSGTNQRAPDKDITYRYLPNTYQERQAILAARKKFIQGRSEFIREEFKKLGKFRSNMRGPNDDFDRFF